MCENAPDYIKDKYGDFINKSIEESDGISSINGRSGFKINKGRRNKSPFSKGSVKSGRGKGDTRSLG